jgi:hypothetical protein
MGMTKSNAGNADDDDSDRVVICRSVPGPVGYAPDATRAWPLLTASNGLKPDGPVGAGGNAPASTRGVCSQCCHPPAAPNRISGRPSAAPVPGESVDPPPEPGAPVEDDSAAGAAVAVKAAAEEGATGPLPGPRSCPLSVSRCGSRRCSSAGRCLRRVRAGSAGVLDSGMGWSPRATRRMVDSNSFFTNGLHTVTEHKDQGLRSEKREVSCEFVTW